MYSHFTNHLHNLIPLGINNISHRDLTIPLAAAPRIKRKHLPNLNYRFEYPSRSVNKFSVAASFCNATVCGAAIALIVVIYHNNTLREFGDLFVEGTLSLSINNVSGFNYIPLVISFACAS